MDIQSRRVRGLLYNLKEIESALRQANRPASVDGIAHAVQNFASTPATEFLHESRAALEIVLLGERDLPGTLMGDILEAIASIDKILVESNL